MNVWTLPRQACFSGVNYAINADYRDVLDVIKYLTDSQKPEFIRWKIALGLFYEEEIPVEPEEPEDVGQDEPEENIGDTGGENLEE